MALAAKKNVRWTLWVVFFVLIGGAGVLLNALLSDGGVKLGGSPTPDEAQEAVRKLKILGDAQAGKRQGFVRLNQAEINALLETHTKTQKNRTSGSVKLVKAGVLLNQTDLTFVTWHKAELFGIEFPIVWQRVITPECSTNGWSLKLGEMRVGKVTVPDQFRADVNSFLGGDDVIFQERKNWLASIPTVMISMNEVSHQPELRLYSYIPVIRQEVDPLALPQTTAKAGTNTLAASVRL